MASMTGNADEIDLIAFVIARLDEDEAGAREAADGDSGRWFMGRKWNVYRAEDEARYDEDYQGEENRLVVYGNVKPQSEHIARHGPARVLREVEAGRRLIAGYTGASATYRVALDAHARDLSPDRAKTKAWLDVTAAVMITWQHAVEAEAAVYSDHPDYRKEWAPGV